MLARASLALLLFAAPDVTDVAAVAVAPVSPGTLVTVPALTPLYIRIDAELSSKTNQNGDHFPIHVEEDVRIGDAVVIPAGSRGEGEVIHAAKSGGGGKPGELLVAARFIRVGEHEIRLRSFSLGAKGRDRSDTALGTSIVLGPLGLFVVGGVMTIPSGTVGGAKTAFEMRLPAVAPTIVQTEGGDDEN